jgi:1,2-phenylacetyl-CoA epoxidase catalytic subunit
MPTSNAIKENEQWLLSFYRSSEINGALFFGKVARTVRGPLQANLTHHFADEANHAAYWSRCMADLDLPAIRMGRSYQDHYLEMVGLPSSLMEVMAITHIFEKRAIYVYRRHLRQQGTHAAITGTIDRIMHDERWHVSYVREALDAMAKELGEQIVTGTVNRFAAADKEVYGRTLGEFGERMSFLSEVNPGQRQDDDEEQQLYLQEADNA